jgi:molybdopterin converting factor small subunit
MRISLLSFLFKERVNRQVGRKKNKETVETLIQSLEERYERWEDLNTNGGSDPNWADGTNMNLVRNHIIYYKNKIKEICPEGQYPEIYYKELPPEVDPNYMAKEKEIRSAAIANLKMLLENKDYIYLKEKYGQLSKKEKEETCIDYVLGYVISLEYGIEKENLVTMRRYKNIRWCLESFSRCKEKIKNILSQENRQPVFEQICLFNML